MSKRFCKFTDKLREKYPYIKQTKNESFVRCEKCNSEFSIASGGDTDIKRHLNTAKHISVLSAASSTTTLSSYFKSSSDFETAAKEGVWAYHVVSSNQSFASSDCAANIWRFGTMPLRDNLYWCVESWQDQAVSSTGSIFFAHQKCSSESVRNHRRKRRDLPNNIRSDHVFYQQKQIESENHWFLCRQCESEFWRPYSWRREQRILQIERNIPTFDRLKLYRPCYAQRHEKGLFSSADWSWIYRLWDIFTLLYLHMPHRATERVLRTSERRICQTTWICEDSFLSTWTSNQTYRENIWWAESLLFIAPERAQNIARFFCWSEIEILVNVRTRASM